MKFFILFASLVISYQTQAQAALSPAQIQFIETQVGDGNAAALDNLIYQGKSLAAAGVNKTMLLAMIQAGDPTILREPELSWRAGLFPSVMGTARKPARATQTCKLPKLTLTQICDRQAKLLNLRGSGYTNFISACVRNYSHCGGPFHLDTPSDATLEKIRKAEQESDDARDRYERDQRRHSGRLFNRGRRGQH